MADPQHVPDLDGFDVLTVRLYRGGLACAALGLAIMGLADLGTALDLTGSTMQIAGLLCVLAGCASAIANMHLYDKRVRWIIRSAGGLGGVLFVAGLLWPEPTIGRWIWHAGLGFVFVSLSAFALKEQFCFKIPFLRLVPALLALALIPLLADMPLASGLTLLAASAPYLVLVVAKVRMPEHFDIGDRSRYQI